MSVSFEFMIIVNKLSGKDKTFHAMFFTTQLSATPGGPLPSKVNNEVEVGALFSAVRSRRLLSCVVPGERGQNSAAIHALIATPANQPILEITMDFIRTINRPEVKTEATPGPGLIPVFKSRRENSRCEQTVAKLGLSRVELSRFRATEG